MLPTDDPREKMVWTTPIAHSIDKIVRRRGQSICVLASGDPKQKLLQWHSEFGGELTRIAIQRAEPLGKFLGWKAMAPVTQWLVVKLFAA
jgi:precorrin-6Y C5,15-methyltransferase (decarboxylating)